jgi:hypothetical protein
VDWQGKCYERRGHITTTSISNLVHVCFSFSVERNSSSGVQFLATTSTYWRWDCIINISVFSLKTLLLSKALVIATGNATSHMGSQFNWPIGDKATKSRIKIEFGLKKILFFGSIFLSMSPSKVYGRNISCAMNACIWVFKLKLSNLDWFCSFSFYK